MTSSTAASSCLALVALALVTGEVAAQPSPNSAAATAQFDQGRALMKQKKYAEACAAFERSQKLEAAPGTLYNLASCYVEIGRLATAWAAFRDLAARDPNKARRRAAAKQAAALAKRMPKIKLVLEDPPPGAVVTLDGTDVTSLLGVETPIDLGTHTIEARAPRLARFAKKVKVREEGKRVVVDIELAPEGTGDVVPPDPSPPDEDAGAPRPITAPIAPVDAPPASSRKRTGIVLAGGGALLMIGGALVGRLAGNAWDDAKALCGEDLQCDDATQLEQGNQLVSDARLRANIATGMFIGGAIAVGVGAYLVVTAPRAESSSRRAVRVTPTVGPALAGVLVEGRF